MPKASSSRSLAMTQAEFPGNGGSILGAAYEVQAPRITVDTENDWERIKGNLEKEIERVCELKFTADPSLSKEVKQEVLSRMKEWSATMFELAIPNMRVNGYDFEDYLEKAAVEDTEPFDEPLDRKIRSNAAEKETYMVLLAERKGKTPAAVKGLVEDLSMRRNLAEWRAAELESIDAEIAAAEAHPPKPETIASLNDSLDTIVELSTNAPTQLAKALRVKDASEAVEQLAT